MVKRIKNSGNPCSELVHGILWYTATLVHWYPGILVPCMQKPRVAAGSRIS